MMRTTSRSGFTIVELLMSSGISLIIFTALASTLIFCQRMLRESMTEAELTLAQREIRDKLLFQAGPGLNEGLLTGRVHGDSASITTDWQVNDNASNNHGPNKIRLLLHSDALGNYLFNERCDHNARNERWFRPDGIRLKSSWQNTVDLPLVRLDLGSATLTNVCSTTWILLPLEPL